MRGADVFVVQSTSTPGNDHLMEMLLMLDAFAPLYEAWAGLFVNTSCPSTGGSDFR